MKVAVVDYGAGNLRSVVSALRSLGCDPMVIASSEVPAAAHAMVLPGVGAATDTMQNLHRRGLSEVIRHWIEADRPFLGICMGLQVLFSFSEEGTGQSCLDIVPGRVVRLPQGHKVPHMGWNRVQYSGDSVLFRGIADGSFFYFVHSYYARPEDTSVVAAHTTYGLPFCAAVRRGSLFATQFHPEKSGPLGLQLYRNFIQYSAH
jgi:glutamine amidotransferase